MSRELQGGNTSVGKTDKTAPKKDQEIGGNFYFKTIITTTKTDKLLFLADDISKAFREF